MDNIYIDTIWVSAMANISHDLAHKTSFIYFVDRDKEKISSSDIARGH